MEYLKKLRIAYECAINYDAVPNESEASEIKDFMGDEECIFYCTIYDLRMILREYEGYSVSNITDLIIKAIDNL